MAGIINVNQVSNEQPIGTVSLARLTFRALAAPGTTSQIAINVTNLLTGDSIPFPSFMGFTGEIFITASQNMRTSIQPLIINPGYAEIQTRLLAMRRPGFRLKLYELGQDRAGAFLLVREFMIVEPTWQED